MPTYAVIGASRGIGLEYVRQLARKPDATVFAVVRNAKSSTHLAAVISGFNNVHVVEADVANYRSLETAAKEIGKVTGGKLDCLIHNAAVMDPHIVSRGFDSFKSMDELDEDFIYAFKVNALGVVHSISAFLPLLRASPATLKKIVVIGTDGANPDFVRTTGIAEMAAYGMTKAAGLMATTKWSLKLKDEGFVVVSLTPGLVDTSGTIGETGDPATHQMFVDVAENLKNIEAVARLKLETPEQSVSAQLKLIDGLKASDNGLTLSHY